MIIIPPNLPKPVEPKPKPPASNNDNNGGSSGGSTGGSSGSYLKEYEDAGGSAGTGYKNAAEYHNAQNDIKNASFKAEHGYNPRTTQEQAEARKINEASKTPSTNKSTNKAPVQPLPPKPPQTLPEGAKVIMVGSATRIMYKGVQYNPQTFYEEQARIGTDRMGIYTTPQTPEYRTNARINEFIDRGYGEYVDTEKGFEIRLTEEGKAAKQTFINALNRDFPNGWEMEGSADTLFFSGKTIYRDAPPLLNKNWEVGNEAVYSSGRSTSLMGISNLFASAPTETATAYQEKPLLNKKWELGEQTTIAQSGKKVFVPNGGNLFSSGVLMEEPKTASELYRERETQINTDIEGAFGFKKGLISGAEGISKGIWETYQKGKENAPAKDFTGRLGYSLIDATYPIASRFALNTNKFFYEIPQAVVGTIGTKGVLLGEYILSGSARKSQTAQEVIKQDIGGLYTGALFGASSFIMSFRENPMKATIEAGRYGLTEVVPAVAVGNLYLLSGRQLGETIFPTKAPSVLGGTPKTQTIEQPLTREQLATNLKNKLASEGALRSERMLDVPARINKGLPSNMLEGEFNALNEPTIPGTTRMAGDWGSLKAQTNLNKLGQGGLPTRSELATALKNKLASEGVLDYKGSVPYLVEQPAVRQTIISSSDLLSRSELATALKNKLAGEGVLIERPAVMQTTLGSDLLSRSELATALKNKLAGEGVLDLGGTVPFRSEATMFNVGKNFFNAPSKTIELGKEWGSLKAQTNLNKLGQGGLPTRSELANALEKKLTGTFDMGRQQTLFNVPEEYLPKTNAVLGTTSRSTQTTLFGESWGSLKAQTTMPEWIGQAGLPTREVLGRLFKNQLAKEGVLSSEKLLMVPEKISPAYSFEAGGYVKKWSLEPKYQRTITDFGDVLNKAPKETGAPIQTGKGTLQLTKTATEIKAQTLTKELATTKQSFFLEPGTKAPDFMQPGFKGGLVITSSGKATIGGTLLGALKPKEQQGRYVGGVVYLPASFSKQEEGMNFVLKGGQESKLNLKTELGVFQKQVFIPATANKEKQELKSLTGLALKTLSLQKTGQGTRADTLTDLNTKQATLQRTQQNQLQNQIELTIQPTIQIETPFTEEPPPGDGDGGGGDEPPPPPPTFKFGGSSQDPFDRKRKKKKQPTFKTPSTLGKRTVYADLFSINASQVKYGKGTSPSMIKRPGTWKYERGGFGRIPTTEQLDKPKPKKNTNTFNNLISGFKKRGKKWF